MFRYTLMPSPLQIVTVNLRVDRSNRSHSVAPRSVAVYAAQRAGLIARLMNTDADFSEPIYGSPDTRNQ